jgi:hypothetical protein
MGATAIPWPRKRRELHNHHFDSTIWNDFDLLRRRHRHRNLRQVWHHLGAADRGVAPFQWRGKYLRRGAVTLARFARAAERGERPMTLLVATLALAVVGFTGTLPRRHGLGGGGCTVAATGTAAVAAGTAVMLGTAAGMAIAAGVAMAGQVGGGPASTSMSRPSYRR